jgi:outer membrane immunogenic protein
MRKLFSISGLAAAAALAWAGSASAADMAVKAPPAPVVPPIYNWSGVYVGVHTGYSWGRLHDVQDSGFTADSDVNNPIVGFHVGYNWQFANAPWGAWVIGVEGGLNEPVDNNDRGNFVACANPAFRCGLTNFKDNWYAGGRLGLAWNWGNGGWLFGGDYLFTVSGGFTTAIFQRADFSVATGVLNAGGGQSLAGHDGAYVGVGLEHVWAKGVLVDWIGGIDYQHQFYDNQRDIDANGVGHTLSADVDIIRFRTTLKFKP